MLNLNQLLPLRHGLVAVKRWYYTRIFGMHLHPTAQFSLRAHLDKTHPTGVYVGEYSWIALGAMVFTHDYTREVYLDTRIGARCFIGAGSKILPGVTIGDGSIVAMGAVVTRDVPAGSLVAGNPARVIRSGLHLTNYGKFPEAHARMVHGER